ncbi:Clavaminate synthase-like protein [Tothia fuscella]|uniref:Clavaminate synthase-like protein n=1 Tax=Tothia fuscella TaxID=1048955 RepID=A0A9P4NSF9_9PEZI|nr:Clavaminate synthase-like protein [Tothia fuscella]
MATPNILKLEDTTNYQTIPETKETLDWADLVTLDLSQFDAPGGIQNLASQLKTAIHTIGFFYSTNFEEKNSYLMDKSLPGGPLGYKPAGLRKVAGDVKDNVETYGDPKYNAFYKERARPAPCVEEATKTEAFCRHIHEHILYRLLVLTGMIMELEDEEALWKLHNIAVNVADTLSFLTGGYLKSSIHRVVLPPKDQQHIPRLSVIYFSRPGDDTLLRAVDSPVIRREGDQSKLPPDNVLTAGEWVQARYNNIPANYARKREDRMKVPTTIVKNIEVRTCE